MAGWENKIKMTVKNAKPCFELNAQFEPEVPGFTGAQRLEEIKDL
jgi:hypothetical protein